MTKPISPLLRALIPRTEREYQAKLHQLGIREPRPGRPRKGESEHPSDVLHIRIPSEIRKRAARKAHRKHTDLNTVVRRLVTEYALS